MPLDFSEDSLFSFPDRPVNGYANKFYGERVGEQPTLLLCLRRCFTFPVRSFTIDGCHPVW
jgi:hypothetical protein